MMVLGGPCTTPLHHAYALAPNKNNDNLNDGAVSMPMTSFFQHLAKLQISQTPQIPSLQ